MSCIFISYSHKDSKYAHRLAETLEQKGFSVWIDDRIDYGTRWPDEIQKQLDGCSAFIVIMTPRSYQSDWVQSELARANRKGKPIFPLLIEGEPWLSVEAIQYVDVRGGKLPLTSFYARLAKVVPHTKVSSLQAEKKPLLSVWRILGTLVVIIGVIWAIYGIYTNWYIPATSAPKSKIVTSPPLPTPEPPTNTPAALPQTITASNGSPMVLIPAGPFTMGNDPRVDEYAGDAEQPVHEVTLDAFYIDQYEVTNAQYAVFVQETNHRQPDDWKNGMPPSGKQDHPVVYVSWHDAVAYCHWLTKTNGRTYRLPTEAEWEKTARGTDGRIYPWGNEWDEKLANTGESGPGDTTPVGSYPDGASPYGVYDMAGNVYELVADWFDEDYYGTAPSHNPQGPDDGDWKVMRGGSYDSYLPLASVTLRNATDPVGQYGSIGFRCAADVATDTTAFMTIPTNTPEPTTHTPTPSPTNTREPPTNTPTSTNTPQPPPPMVLIPAGTFTMGSDPREVTLDAFYIDQYEVTNARYVEFLRVQGNRQEEGVRWLKEYGRISQEGDKWQVAVGYIDHPMTAVTWYGAKAYCEWRGDRLPTEAEWEKAARGTDGRIYPWGNDFDGNRLNYCDRNCEKEWADQNYDDGYIETAPVGSYPNGVSPYGVYDMAGNVGEWVADWYDQYYYATAPDHNPPGPDDGEYKGLRGGAWYFDESYAHATHRGYGDANHGTVHNGFRCAADATE